MSSIITVPYSGGVVQGTVTTAVTGVAHLWGGGGGSGGNDSYAGATGGGASYARVNFQARPGQVLTLAVGQRATNGAGCGSGAPGGVGGSSYVGNPVSLPTDGPNPYTIYYTPFSYPAYAQFVNRYGVWDGDGNYYWYTYFPRSNSYDVTIGADNHAWFYIDDALVIETPGDSSFANPVSTTVFVTQGYHVIKIVGADYGPPGCIAAAMTNGWTTRSARYPSADSYSGANGGRAGYGGCSGGGGGGGGSTVLFLDNTLIGVGGGGGGGGGGGNQSPAPGPGGDGGYSGMLTAGQNGGDKSGDGGGGGAGGGGYRGGNGAGPGGGDTGGGGGATGYPLGTYTELDSGTKPGGTTSGFWSGNAGYGGSGAGANNAVDGLAVFQFVAGGLSIKDGGEWKTVNTTYIKDAGQWKEVQAIYVKRNGAWQLTQGISPVSFSAVSGSWGLQPR